MSVIVSDVPVARPVTVPVMVEPVTTELHVIPRVTLAEIVPEPAPLVMLQFCPGGTVSTTLYAVPVSMLS